MSFEQQIKQIEDELSELSSYLTSTYKSNLLEKLQEVGSRYLKTKVPFMKENKNYLNLKNKILNYNTQFIEQQKILYSKFLNGEIHNQRALSTEQQEAVLIDDKHNLIIAAAGSGKTSVITFKIVHLIKHLNISPEEIIVLAFNNSAAREIQGRLNKNFNIDMNIMTFHKFGLEILKDINSQKLEIIDTDKLIETIFNKLIIESNKFQIQYLNLITLGKYLNLKHLSNLELFKKIKKQNRDQDMLSSFKLIINNAKARRIYPKTLYKRLQKEKDPNIKQFGILALTIYREYEKYLKQTNSIDFNDMINKATHEVLANPRIFKNKYKYLIVDEFQDISHQRNALLQAFVNTKSQTKLYCVGDDWQSIYKFAGSDVDLFVNFEKYFPLPSLAYLSTNYRSNNSIVNFASRIIKQNSNQVSKIVKAFNKLENKPIVIYMKTELNEEKYLKAEVDLVINKSSELINTQKIIPDEILILSRYNKHLENFKKEIEKYKPTHQWISEIKYLTIHKAKGSEASAVFILNVRKGNNGFPSQKRNSPLLSLIKKLASSDELLEEERRLFYVAVTRAKDHLFILSQRGLESEFLNR